MKRVELNPNTKLNLFKTVLKGIIVRRVSYCATCQQLIGDIKHVKKISYFFTVVYRIKWITTANSSLQTLYFLTSFKYIFICDFRKNRKANVIRLTFWIKCKDSTPSLISIHNCLFCRKRRGFGAQDLPNNPKDGDELRHNFPSSNKKFVKIITMNAEPRR